MALPADASLVLRLDDTSATWQDTAGTTAASANGATVQRIDDASGNGYNATLLAGDTAATLKVGTYSQKAVAALNSRFTLGQPAALVAVVNGTSPWTLVQFLRPAGTSTQAFTFTKGGSAARVNFAAFNNVNTLGLMGLGHYSQVMGPCPDVRNPVPFAYSIYPNEQVPCRRLYVAGAAVANVNNAAQPAIDTTSDFYLFGNNVGTSYRFPGDHLATYLYSRTLSPAEVLQVSDYCYTHWGVTNPRLAAPYQLAFSGNSLLTQSAGNPAMPEKVRQVLGLPMGSVHNLAIGGQTTSQMTTDDPTRLDGLLPYLANPLLCGWECSNQQSTANYSAWAAARAAAGWNARMLATVLPRNFGAFNTQRAIDNAAIRAFAPSVCQYVADIAADPVVGIDAAALSDPGLYGDGVHYSEQGGWFVMRRWADAIRAAMVPGPVAHKVRFRLGAP